MLTEINFQFLWSTKIARKVDPWSIKWHRIHPADRSVRRCLSFDHASSDSLSTLAICTLLSMVLSAPSCHLKWKHHCYCCPVAMFFVKAAKTNSIFVLCNLMICTQTYVEQIHRERPSWKVWQFVDSSLTIILVTQRKAMSSARKWELKAAHFFNATPDQWHRKLSTNDFSPKHKVEKHHRKWPLAARTYIYIYLYIYIII